MEISIFWMARMTMMENKHWASDNQTIIRIYLVSRY